MSCNLYKEKYMKRAIELAEKGKGFVSPNPLVGALIVRENEAHSEMSEIVSEGWHEKYGEAHAEVNAINSAKGDLSNCSMYVTLEPCSHHGKTPPCTQAIINSGIKKVFIGILDPNPNVSGNGVEVLRNNGIDVEYGFLEKEISVQNEVFLKYIQTGTPFCVMKTAMSLDGKICTYSGNSKWISNEKSRKYVHKLRHELTAIMVGVNTVIKDDPQLNTRLFKLPINETEESLNDTSKEYGINSDTIKIVVDSTGRIPIDAKLFKIDSDKPVIIATTSKMSEEKENQLNGRGAIVLRLNDKNGRVDLNSLMKELGSSGSLNKLNIDSILLEGGGTLNYSALESGIVDKVISFIAPKIIGGKDSLSPVEGQGVETVNEAFELEDISVSRFDEDIMIEGYVRDDMFLDYRE